MRSLPWRDRHIRDHPRTIENYTSELRLFNADRFGIGLMVEPAIRVVVPRRIAGSDIEWHVQAASDLVEDFLLEFCVGCRWLPGCSKFACRYLQWNLNCQTRISLFLALQLSAPKHTFALLLA